MKQSCSVPMIYISTFIKNRALRQADGVSSADNPQVKRVAEKLGGTDSLVEAPRKLGQSVFLPEQDINNAVDGSGLQPHLNRALGQVDGLSSADDPQVKRVGKKLGGNVLLVQTVDQLSIKILNLTLQPKEVTLTSVMGPDTFSVGVDGCTVTSPYCNLIFPPGAAQRSVNIKMEPIYYPGEIIDGRVLLTPMVNFSSENNLVFQEEVEISLYTSYSAVGKPVPVKILREAASQRQESYKDALLRADDLITFKTTEFCRFAAHAAREERESYQRRYYYAAFRSTESSNYHKPLVWYFYEDIPNTRNDRETYFASRKMVIEPQCITIGYERPLLSLILERVEADQAPVDVTGPRQFLDLHQMLGKKVDENFQFMISRRGMENIIRPIQLEYSVGTGLLSREDDIPHKLSTKQCAFFWSEDRAEDPAARPPDNGRYVQTQQPSFDLSLGDT